MMMPRYLLRDFYTINAVIGCVVSSIFFTLAACLLTRKLINLWHSSMYDIVCRHIHTCNTYKCHHWRRKMTVDMRLIKFWRILGKPFGNGFEYVWELKFMCMYICAENFCYFCCCYAQIEIVNNLTNKNMPPLPAVCIFCIT